MVSSEIQGTFVPYTDTPSVGVGVVNLVTDGPRSYSPVVCLGLSTVTSLPRFYSNGNLSPPRLFSVPGTVFEETLPSRLFLLGSFF